MTDTSTRPSSRPLNSDEAAAVLLLRGGATRERAAAETGLTIEQVDAAIARANENRAARAVPAGVAAPRTVPAGQQQPFLAPVAPAAPAAGATRPTVGAEPKKVDGSEALLRWAEQSDIPRARRLAERARTALAELHGLENRGSAISAAKARVAELERQLLAAKSALRAAAVGKGVSSPGPKPVPRRDELAAIRAWASANGHEVADRGRIPESVVAAYRAAHAPADDFDA